MASCCCWVLSLMAGSTTGVLMFPVYGEYQATVVKEYYTPYYTTSIYATPLTTLRGS